MKSNDDNSMNHPKKNSRQSAEEAFNESLQQLQALLEDEENQQDSQPPKREKQKASSDFTADEWEDVGADLENFFDDSDSLD